MQKHVNLVDLVKSFPTNIYLQNLASIQKRTSPVKFAHLAEKSRKGSISNLSTKVLEMFRTFTVRNCKCQSNDVRDKLLSIIEAGCGTLDDFDDLIRGIELRFFDKDASPRSTASRTPISMSPGFRRTRTLTGDDHSSPSSPGGQRSPAAGSADTYVGSNSTI